MRHIDRSGGHIAMQLIIAHLRVRRHLVQQCVAYNRQSQTSAGNVIGSSKLIHLQLNVGMNPSLLENGIHSKPRIRTYSQSNHRGIRKGIDCKGRGICV